MFALRLRMYLLLAVLFAIVYSVFTVIGINMGVYNFYFYIGLSLFFMFIQYMIGPKIVEWSMKINYIDEKSYPELHRMVKDMSMRANIPCPRIGIARINLPNAFAFGRTIKDGRICVTEEIMRILSKEELRAVLGHELSHLKNRDVLTITVLSVIPMLLYRIAWHFFFFGGGRRRDRGSSNTALIGIAAFLFYLITNLLVLYASRIREYFADRGSVSLGNKPYHLASALYKIVSGSSILPKQNLRDFEGMKAFFLNNPNQASKEIADLKQLDLDKNGVIDETELMAMRSITLRLKFGDKFKEFFSTHPNILKRIKNLSLCDYYLMLS